MSPSRRYRLVMAEEKPPPAYCTWCGTQAPDGAPPTWTVQTSERGLQTLCESCTRSNLRSIEANLSTDYW